MKLYKASYHSQHPQVYYSICREKMTAGSSRNLEGLEDPGDLQDLQDPEDPGDLGDLEDLEGL